MSPNKVTNSKTRATQTSQQSEAMIACSTRFETGYCPSMGPNFAKTERLLRPDNKTVLTPMRAKNPALHPDECLKKYRTLKNVYIGCVMCKISIKWREYSSYYCTG
jgi:hypothetical protein